MTSLLLTPAGTPADDIRTTGFRMSEFPSAFAKTTRRQCRLTGHKRDSAWRPFTVSVRKPDRSAARSCAATFGASNSLSPALAPTEENHSNGRSYSPLVKMCGITTPEDASLAAQAGARYVGMIIWPHSKRSVSLSAAKEICSAAREFGAEPVGVFVSEGAREIEKACDFTGLSFAQLHGDGARASLLQLSRSLKTIYVMQADAHGLLQTTITPEQGRLIDWALVDGIEAGSGLAFSWDNFKVPPVCTNKGWFLAGGLHPENVGAAVSILRPNAVDVASGIAGPDGIRKDPSRILAFMQAVRVSCGTSKEMQ